MANEFNFAEAEKARAAVDAAQKTVADLQKQIDDLKARQGSQVDLIDLNIHLQEAVKALAEVQKAATAAAVKHVWTKDDTYASLAQKYYGSFTEPYWRLIYEYNKEIIGNHPNDIRVGLEIVIPPLPNELRKA